MADKLVKVAVPHIKGCAAVRLEREGSWDTCWGPVAYGGHGAPVVTTKRRYGKNGSVFRHWLRFICNDTACSAELHVETDFILQAVKRNTSSTRVSGK